MREVFNTTDSPTFMSALMLQQRKSICYLKKGILQII